MEQQGEVSVEIPAAPHQTSPVPSMGTKHAPSRRSSPPKSRAPSTTQRAASSAEADSRDEQLPESTVRERAHFCCRQQGLMIVCVTEQCSSRLCWTRGGSERQHTRRGQEQPACPSSAHSGVELRYDSPIHHALPAVQRP